MEIWLCNESKNEEDHQHAVVYTVLIKGTLQNNVDQTEAPVYVRKYTFD